MNCQTIDKWARNSYQGDYRNSYQGDYRKVLCVCAGGRLRSPTAAVVLSQTPYHFNTRTAGLAGYALIPVNLILLSWADEIVVMEKEQEDRIREMFTGFTSCDDLRPIVCLDIPDEYAYRDPRLVELIHTRYQQKSGWGK